MTARSRSARALPGPGHVRAAAPASAATARPGTILQGGRAKAFRPIPEEARRRAFNEGVAAYDRGDFFEAHELLEPAWMGTADPAERDLLQGLIKLAAGYVHGVRGNPLGIARNLTGARERLAGSADSPAAAASGIDIAALVTAIDDRLARLARDPADATVDAPALPRLR
jgi:predicted metal-dependent hydrolase